MNQSKQGKIDTGLLPCGPIAQWSEYSHDPSARGPGYEYRSGHVLFPPCDIRSSTLKEF